MTPADTLRRERAQARRESLELEMLQQIRAARVADTMQQQYQWHESRRWRADFAWPDRRVLLEVHGATWVMGRHNRGTGYAEDRRKANEAQLRGWTYIEATAEHVRSGQALEWIRRAHAQQAE